MPAKKIHRGLDARNGLLKGVKEIVDTVKSTLGPRGKNVIVERAHLRPLVTKDGVTVAENITLEDGVEEMGCSLIIDAAQMTATQAGDGTTTACVLSQAIFEQGVIKSDQKLSPIKMMRGMDSAVDDAIHFIHTKMSKTVKEPEELKSVATIASNGDVVLGNLIGSAMDRAGIDGCIVVQDGDTDNIEIVDGFQIKSGMKDRLFSLQKQGICELKNTLVFVYNKALSSTHEVVPLLNYAVAAEKPIVIFAKDFSAEVLQTLIINRAKKVVSCLAVKLPDYGDFQEYIAEDIAALTRAKAITKSMDYDLRKFGQGGGHSWDEFLGKADVIKSTMADTTIVVDDLPDEVKQTLSQRIEEAKTLKAELDEKDNVSRDKHQRRIASMSGGVIKLSIASQTESEEGQKKARVEDALYAVQAAAEHGVVPGGGIALFYAGLAINEMSHSIEDESERAGYQIIANALNQPLYQIASNADTDLAAVVKGKITDKFNEKDFNDYWYGWDADSDKYGDMAEFKIIDPYMVPITALKNALSVAKLLINASSVVEFLQPEQAGDGKFGHVGRS